LKVLAEKQKIGEIVCHYDFSTTKINTIEHAYRQMKKNYEIEENED